MRRESARARVLLRLLSALLVLVPSLPSRAAAPVPPLPLLADGTTTRISTRLDGSQAPGGTYVNEVSVSGNGRYAAFYSTYIPGFPGCRSGTFLRDLVTGRLEMVSVPASGCHKGRRVTPSGSAHSYTSISHDGRWVAFTSSGKDLLDRPLPTRSPTGMGTHQVFLRDRKHGRTRLVSVGIDGKQANAAARRPTVSDDGRWVAFESSATNLVKGDRGDPDDDLRSDVFLRDMRRGVTIRVGPDLRRERRGPKLFPSLSGDGRWVAFDTEDGELAPHKGTGGGVLEARYARHQVWVWDRVTKRVELVSRSAAGYAAAGLATLGGNVGSKISRDGRWIVYQSDARNITGPNTGLRQAIQLYLYDRVTKTPVLVTHGRAGEGGLGPSQYPCLSPDGRFVSFASIASNLADGDVTPGYFHGYPDVGTDVLLWDRVSRTTRLVSRSTEGVPADRNSRESCPSSGGRTVAFISNATTLVPGDTNDAPDVFARRYAP